MPARRLKQLICIVLSSIVLLPLPSLAIPAASSASTQLTEFISGFPDNTQVQGELSAIEFQRELQQTKAALARLREIDPSQLQGDDLIDWQFAQSILSGRVLAQEQVASWQSDPRRYLDFGAISRELNRPGPPADRIKILGQALQRLPARLANGEAQLRHYVPRFQKLALFMAENGASLFQQELPAFIKQHAEAAEMLSPLVTQAATALQHYVSFLRDDLPRRPQRDFAMGEASYNAMLQQQFLLDYDAASLWQYGWQQFESTVSELEAVAQRIDPDKTWQQLAVEIKNDYPAPDQMIAAHQDWVNRAAAHIRDKQLIPIPWRERVEVVARAPYLRKTSYYGNFSITRGKGADGVFTSYWNINPFEAQWDENTQREYLTEHDWGVIIVTAPHESYGGHHVQGLYQLHNPRPLRRQQGTSLFSEGWGLYNEHLMQETGFFPDERVHLRQLQLRLWRNARVIYDVGIHTGRMNYSEAVALMTDRVGFLPWAAQLEVDSAAASPGYFIGYFVGMTEILAIRREYKEREGDDFTLRQFHRELLSIGNMPPSLMRKALFQEK